MFYKESRLGVEGVSRFSFDDNHGDASSIAFYSDGDVFIDANYSGERIWLKRDQAIALAHKILEELA